MSSIPETVHSNGPRWTFRFLKLTKKIYNAYPRAIIKVHFRSKSNEPVKSETLSSTLRVYTIKPAKCHVKQNMLTKRYRRCHHRHRHHHHIAITSSSCTVRQKYILLCEILHGWNDAYFQAVHCCASTTRTHTLYPIWWSCVKSEVIHHFPHTMENPIGMPLLLHTTSQYENSISFHLSIVYHTHTQIDGCV